jgi:peptide/nickel transport system ATP-binding protein
MPLLRVRNLVTDIELRSSTVHVVRGVSFDVDAGETLGLVGESGSGKTMTGMSIMGLLPNGGRVQSGNIELDGKDIAGCSEKVMGAIRGNEIGMVYQDPMTSLNPTMRIGEQIAESVRWHWKSNKESAMNRAIEVLDLVGLPKPRERYHDYPHQLSGGLRQRVMIAMALACEPKLLIADEPTTALDVSIQAQILELLQQLKERLGMAMILITHDMGVVAGRTDRVIVMYGGKIVESAPTSDLFYDTRHRYTEALLQSIPRLDQISSERLNSIPGSPPDLRKAAVGCSFVSRCKYSIDRCAVETPVLEGGDVHQFACFNPPLLGERESHGERLNGRSQRVNSPRNVVGDVTNALDSRTISISDATEDVYDQFARADLAPATATSEPGPEAVITLVDVSKDFLVHSRGIITRKVEILSAVSGVSLAIHKGETFGVVGESGCGKTTLGRIMVALEAATSGVIEFEGHNLAEMSKSNLRRFRRDLQMMFQDPYSSLDPRMNVGTIVREPLDIQSIGTRKSRDLRVKELLAEVGLPAMAERRHPHEFSGGQRQRIGLARALALQPKLIVADEPVSALDVSIRSQVLNLMKSIQDSHQVTYVVISHDLSVVRYLADRIGVMYLGRLVEVGTREDVYERTAHHYTAGLLEAVPVPDPESEQRKRGSAIQGELPSSLHPPSGCRFRTRCPHAEEICATDVPPLRSLGDSHFVACHFPITQPLAIRSSSA